MISKTHDGSHGEDCFGCRIQSVQFDPRATPSRRNNEPPSKAAPAWERGIAGEHRRDGSFMPFIDDRTMNPIRVKQFGEHRHRYEEAIRRVRQPQE